MAISAEKWKVLEEELNSLFLSTTFSLDGRKLTIRWLNTAKSGFSYKLFVYIDEKIQPANGWKESKHYDPFVEKVWRKRTQTITLFKKGELAGKSKRELAAVNSLKKKYPDKVRVSFDYCFPTASVLIRQYKKLEGLEVIEL